MLLGPAAVALPILVIYEITEPFSSPIDQPPKLPGCIFFCFTMEIFSTV